MVLNPHMNYLTLYYKEQLHLAGFCPIIPTLPQPGSDSRILPLTRVFWSYALNPLQIYENRLFD